MNIQELAGKVNSVLTEKVYVYESTDENLLNEVGDGTIVYFNTEECHNEGYLNDAFIDEQNDLADLLGLAELQESVYESGEPRDEFITKLQELVKLCPNLILTEAPFEDDCEDED